MLQELWPARKQLAERGHNEDGVKQGSEGRAGADLLTRQSFCSYLSHHQDGIGLSFGSENCLDCAFRPYSRTEESV